MKVLERLPVMSDAELLSLAENARANLAKPSRSADAQLVLDALSEEQGRRAAVRAEAGAQAQAVIRERMAELGLRRELPFGSLYVFSPEVGSQAVAICGAPAC